MKIDLSFSILQKWQRGDRDGAIRALMGDWEGITTPAMAKGTRIHEKIAREKLRPISWMKGGEYEFYNRIEINECISYGGYIDWHNGETLIDWKTGNTESNQHNKLQLFGYALLLPTATKGMFVHINDDMTVADYSVYKLGDSQRELAVNYIETIGGEILTSLH